MAIEDDITHWTELQEFKGVDLTSSYVLSWGVSGELLQIDVDVCLTPRHALYEPPRRSDDACIMPAEIEFPSCERLEAAGRRAANGGIQQLTRSLAHGRIKNLQRIAEGVYRIDGAFGSVVIHSERPLLRLRLRDR